MDGEFHKALLLDEQLQAINECSERKNRSLKELANWLFNNKWSVPKTYVKEALNAFAYSFAHTYMIKKLNLRGSRWGYGRR